ncbi:MAG: tRNA pseudouridine(55) synthase TruB [Deltaproteobacteria bacterium]|nr:tRNA pseudouridine(55) synthase TruB [Deltaproteobacteria bacterium]
MALLEQGGFLVVDKPAGKTSHDIVGMARRALHTREVGHTGTLDPFATGLLVLLTGALTRAADLVGQGRKRYAATARLGVETTTDDLTGEPVVSRPVHVTDAALAAALGGLTGSLRQVPPAFSAKHVDGERAHERARRGEAVELRANDVTVYAITLTARRGDELDLTVECSRGTYIRSLARDLGRALGCGAHLAALRRTQVGPFSVDNAVAADALSEGALHPAPELGALLPTVEIDEPGATELWQGKALRVCVVGGMAWGAGEGGLIRRGEALVALATARCALVPGQAAGARELEVGRRFPAPPSQASSAGN